MAEQPRFYCRRRQEFVFEILRPVLVPSRPIIRSVNRGSLLLKFDLLLPEIEPRPFSAQPYTVYEKVKYICILYADIFEVWDHIRYQLNDMLTTKPQKIVTNFSYLN
jgi:hypothetical protein